MRLALLLTAALAATPATADDITDTLQSAITAYQEGDIQYALEEIAYAQQLLSELKAGALEAFLPEAPAGWTREIDASAGGGMAAMGGTGASAVYSDGNQRFTLTILTDSPMIMGMANIFGNSALMASQGKMVRVGREKFLQQSDNQLMGMIDGRIMIQAEGAPAEVMLPVLEAIDFRELGRFGQ